MPKNKRAKTKGAILAMPYDENMLTPVNIEINGFVYTSQGSSRIESLVDAVEAHIGEDREFKESITIMQAGFYNEIVYAPAALCTLGYLDKGDLYNLIIGETMNGLEDENNG